MNNEDYLYLESETILNNKYIILKNISERSNFSIVYLARDIHTSEELVIKEFFPKDICLRDMDKKSLICKRTYSINLFNKEKERFINEAKIMNYKEHNNLAKYFDSFSENNTSYIVMKYYLGKDLETYLKQNSETDWTLFIKNIIFPVIDGLKILHKKRIIHRDLKPSNILLTGNCAPVIIDFGSAVSINDDIKKIFVTPGFSPIEFYAEKSKQDKRSDIYSLTAIIYYYFLGKPPRDSLLRLQEETIEEISSFPKLLGKFIEKNLNLNLKKRDLSLTQYRIKLTIILFIEKTIIRFKYKKWRKDEILQDL